MKLVNFNKIDKLDFDSLQVWSQVTLLLLLLFSNLKRILFYTFFTL